MRWWPAMMLLLTLPGPARGQFAPGKLSRAHASIAGPTQCFQCHEPRKATTPERCLACHRPLAARIAAGTGYHGHLDAGRRSRCGACHVEHGGEGALLVSWPGGRREAFDHRLTGFTLEGKHARLRCEACHTADLVRAADVREARDLDLARTHLGLASRCADCHRDPHRGQFAPQVEAGDCKSCHGQGVWKPAAFDHAAARFPLAGKHRDVACAKCHPSLNESGARVDAGTPGAWVRYRPVDFASCASCHEDAHRGRFGPSCASCHVPDGWRRLDLGRFDHGQTRYALTGRHAQVACEKCHWSEDAQGKRVPAGTAGAKVHYRPIAFASCKDCHKDPHRDRYGQDCARCHDTSGWNRITAGAFDHDRTRYPLRDRHRAVACEKCHWPADAAGKRVPAGTPGAKLRYKPIAFDKCAACHADAHRGQLARRSDHGACEACHDQKGFVPARYGHAEHAASRFPLRDAHLAVACTACHRPPGTTAEAGFDFRSGQTTCNACHADPHAGQFANRGATDCTRCHGSRAWSIPSFEHGKTRFPLDGAHARTACSSCHKPVIVDGKRTARYRPLDTACRSCHAEPVRSQGK
jgi:hypothetical protein